MGARSGNGGGMKRVPFQKGIDSLGRPEDFSPAQEGARDVGYGKGIKVLGQINGMPILSERPQGWKDIEQAGVLRGGGQIIHNAKNPFGGDWKVAVIYNEK